jgi:hypothetical protein
MAIPRPSGRYRRRDGENSLSPTQLTLPSDNASQALFRYQPNFKQSSCALSMCLTIFTQSNRRGRAQPFADASPLAKITWR